MTASRTATFAAFTLALTVTLGIFSGVAGLSAPEHAGQMMVKAAPTTTVAPRA